MNDGYDWGGAAPQEKPTPARESVAPAREAPRSNVVALAAQPAVRLPPWDEPAERAVLSAVMLDPVALPQLAAFLRPEHFYSEAHRRTYEAALALYGAGEAVDVVTVASWLKNRGRLQQVGGIEALAAMLDDSPALANVGSHGAIIANHARAREACALAERIAAQARLPIGDHQEWLEANVAALEAIAREQPGVRRESNLDTLKRIVADAAERLRALTGTPASVKLGLTTGLPTLDLAIGGLHSGRLYGLGGREKRGKTTLARQVAAHVASLGIGVVVFSTEQTRDEWLSALLALRARVPLEVLSGRANDPAAWARAMDAAPGASSLPITIVDTPDIHSGQIIQTVRAMIASRRDGEPPLGLVVVDHLHRLQVNPDDRRETKTVRVGNDARRFKNAARATKLPWMMLLQQRDLDTDRIKDPKPAGNCTAWSSVPEQEADLMAWIWREPPMRGPSARVGDGRPHRLVITHNRQGPTREIALEAFLSAARFDDTEHEERMRAGSRDYVEPLLPEDP